MHVKKIIEKFRKQMEEDIDDVTRPYSTGVHKQRSFKCYGLTRRIGI